MRSLFPQTLQHLRHRGAARNGNTKEVFDLAGSNQHRRAGGKAHHHRVRDKVHQRAKAQHAQQQLKHAHQKRERQDQLHIVRAARLGQRAHGGKHHDRNRRGRPRHQMPGRTPQRRHHGWQHGRVQTVFGRHAGNGGKGHALGHQNQPASQAGNQVSAQRAAGDARPPAQERQPGLQIKLHGAGLEGQMRAARRVRVFKLAPG